jgi:hypothetical protein
MKKLITIFTALLLCFGSVATVFAAEDEFEVSGSKTADPTFLHGDERETTVTLKLPSGEYKYTYDIVFVMDSSSSTANNNIDFSEYAATLMDAITDRNVDLKVGVVKVRGLAFDTISLVTDKAKSELVEYNDENKQDIIDAINFKEADLKALSSGTNMHGGLVIADRWLTADEEVPDDHKFVFFLLDGKTYIWYDDEDIPTSVYGQYMAKNVVYSKPAVGQQTIAYSKSAYRFVDNVNFFAATAEMNNLSFDDYFEATGNFYTADYAKLYASTNEELAKPTKYDYRCGYAYKESSTASGTVTEHALTNGNYTYNLHKKYYEFTPDAAFADLVWLQANPYTVEENDGVYSYTTTVNPDFYQLHPDQLQKALYLTGHLWTDMVEKYNGAVINYNGWSGGSGLELAKSFNEWIKEDGISDYAADIEDADSVAAIFNTVKDDILYMVSRGVVTDQITDDFTLKNPDKVEGFRMTYSGEELPATFEDGKWYFGEGLDGEPAYIVEYDIDTKTITWTINVPIENANPITLSYDLILREDAESAIYPTNVSAILDYVSSDGTRDGEYEFEIPEVVYIREVDINVTKVWEDKDNEDGGRPESVTAIALAGGEELDTKDLNADNEWTVTFEDLPDSTYEDGVFTPIEYDLQEVEVTDYTTEITEEEEYNYVITNTFVPRLIDVTITKVWEDEDDKAGRRAESVTVTLFIDGEEYESFELSEENEWAVALADLKEGHYVDGEFTAYEYTVEEEEVTDYTAEITDDGEYNFTVTNTYTPPTPPTGAPETMALGLLMMSTSLTGMYQVFTGKRKKEEE